MIKIISDQGKQGGSCEYRILANSQHVCKFKHDRADGLAVCLRKAADAVELSDWIDFTLMEDVKGG